mmetsp:Transcript_3417/g.8026  ORF Transcript_3417/g.8026 Transcript_3417/m.8026 type:complete len:167 (-) Transcript_3417:565-1065(-)
MLRTATKAISLLLLEGGLTGAVDERKFLSRAVAFSGDPWAYCGPGMEPACTAGRCSQNSHDFARLGFDATCLKSCASGGRYKTGDVPHCFQPDRPRRRDRSSMKDPTGCYARGMVPACASDGCKQDSQEFETGNADFLCQRDCKRTYRGGGAICLSESRSGGSTSC